jgi:hypothetical protein
MESRRYPGGLIGTVKAKSRALDVAQFIGEHVEGQETLRSGSPLAVTTCCSGTTSPSMQ